MKKRDFVIKVLRYIYHFITPIIYDSSYKEMTLKLIA